MWAWGGGSAKRCRIPPAVGLLLGLAAAPSLAAPPAEPTLSRITVPARGQQEAILTVPAFGRYAVTIASPQGTALQLVDRIAGPGQAQGTTGKTDGRLDVFLDRGEYQVVAFAPEKGSGDAQLKVRGFSERNAPEPPLLVELKPVETALDDYEQRSWWLEVKERRRVILEAAGRNLADLRLWTNGSWLVDAEPAREVVAAQPGRPMLDCRLAAELGPGLYLLTAYGGASQPQSEESAEHPLHLRFGIPRLAAVGRRRFTVSPFGADRWLVPGEASYFRLELPEARPATLRVGADVSHPFEASGSAATIGKNALVPVAELDLGSSTADRVVTVTAAPGQPYLLQHFSLGTPSVCGGRYWALRREGKYWVSSVHSGDPTDSVDATAIVTRWGWPSAKEAHERPFRAQVIALAPRQPWVRRANLLETLNAFLRVERTGKYEVLARGVEARFRIEPFFTSLPPNYAPPDMRGSGSVWDLDAGYYVLTAEPVKKGIVDLAVHAAGEGDPFARAGPGGSVRRSAAQFPEFKVRRDHVYTVYLNRQPEVRAGLVLRPLPLDLREALPVTQRPGETVSARFRVKEEGTLHAEAEDGTALAIAVDGGPAIPSPAVKPGLHRLEVRSAGPATIHYSLALEPLRLQAATALPALPDPSRAKPPELPLLTDERPRFFDLERGADTTFLLRADAPALYRLQSTGLLATEGRLRTRTVTAFARAAANGVGRNFFIEQYLREGDYQITVVTQGSSKGHLGLTLERTQLVDGGTLSEGGQARRALAAGEAVAYHFRLAERVEHVWTEPEAGQARVPDAWLVTVPAPIDARIELTGEMQGELVRTDGEGAGVSVPPGRGWKGKLEAGRYRLDVMCARPNNRVTYQIGLWPEQLVAGLDRDVSAPGTVPLSVGRDGLVQLASFGSADVRARVYDAEDHLVAENDDGADDWNFQIQARLAAGAYRLHVEPVGRASASTVVSMRAPEEAAEPPLALPARTDVALEGSVRVYPLRVPPDAELLLVAASAPESLGCALEAGGRTVGAAVGRTARIEVPLARGGEYRLRLWSVDGRATSAHLTAVAFALPRTTEQQLRAGVALAAARGLEPPAGAVAVALDRPGVFRVGGGVRACSVPDAPCREPANGVVAATGKTLWLVRDRARKTLKATRAVLAPGAARELQVELDSERPAQLDVANPTGDAVLVVATSLAGQPGVVLAAPGAPASPRAAVQGMAVGPHSAVSVASGKRPTAVVWTASPSLVTVREWSVPRTMVLEYERSPDGELEDVGGLALNVDSGPKRVRLALGEATVAAFSDGERITSVHWHGGEPFEETVETSADHLTLFHTRGAQDSFHYEVLPLGPNGMTAPLAPGVPYERADLRAGTVRLAVAPAAASDAERPLALHVRGAGAEAVLVGGDGRVARGTDLALGKENGTLLVRHGPGFVLAWVDRRGEEAFDLWGGAGLPRGTEIAFPAAVVPLAGTMQALRVPPRFSGMLHLRTSTPVLTLVKRGEAPPEVEVHASGAALDTYVAGEPVQIGVRALGGGTLWGTAEVTASRVMKIGEGLGPERLLPAGGTALFSFTVTREGPVGVGVRASPDVVSATLLDAHGKQIGR